MNSRIRQALDMVANDSGPGLRTEVRPPAEGRPPRSSTTRGAPGVTSVSATESQAGSGNPSREPWGRRPGAGEFTDRCCLTGR